ncbi:hypothetical protein ACLKA7_016288 [Drosophila subpalustris]
MTSVEVECVIDLLCVQSPIDCITIAQLHLNKQQRKRSQAKQVIDPDTVKMCDCGCYSYSCSHDLSCYSHSHYHSHSHSHHCCAGYKYLKCLCRYYRHVHCTCSCWRRKCYLL